MAKKIMLFFAVFMLIFCYFGTCFAFEPGNERKGKYMFRKNCRECHKDGASATPLGPNNKTQAQWERAFNKYERFDCVEEWKKVSESDRTDILTYLYNHAVDSPSPATCE